MICAVYYIVSLQGICCVQVDEPLECPPLSASSDPGFQAICFTLIPLTSINLLLIYSRVKEKRMGTIVCLGDIVTEHILFLSHSGGRERSRGTQSSRDFFFFFSNVA